VIAAIGNFDLTEQGIAQKWVQKAFTARGEAAEALKSLEGTYNAYPLGANERGAQLALATNGLSALDQVKRAANGELKALWVVGVDLFSVGLPREEVIKALENVDFLAVQDSRRSETFYYASVALPMTLPAEQDGSYTNCEGTTQFVKAIIPPVGEAKPAWRVFEELSIRLNPRMPFSQASEILATAPAFAR
jgi:predicted molibdopterin-dependent oxidoreductase YjgC